jgi:hypothetical protein
MEMKWHSTQPGEPELNGRIVHSEANESGAAITIESLPSREDCVLTAELPPHGLVRAWRKSLPDAELILPQVRRLLDELIDARMEAETEDAFLEILPGWIEAFGKRFHDPVEGRPLW